MTTPTIDITNLTSPCNLTTTKTISGFLINQVTITPFTEANVVTSLYDASNNLIATRSIVLTGSDYTNWGNNDTYLIDFIESKIPTLTI